MTVNGSVYSPAVPLPSRISGGLRDQDAVPEQLYRMEWINAVHLLLQMFTNSRASVLDAYGRNDQWHPRILYPDRDLFSRTHEFCEDHRLAFDIRSIWELERQPPGRYGLTDEQYEALVEAYQRGYFEVPRGITLAELAEELGVSHQALSERVRRGTGTLVDDTLMIGSPRRTGEK